MNKIYYLDRTSGTAEVKPANDEPLLRVYDSLDTVDTTELEDQEVFAVREDCGGNSILDIIKMLIPVGTVAGFQKVPNKMWLECNGSTFDETAYPELYEYLGTNVLPDYREVSLVGAGQNTTDSIATHDVYTVGQFKDDQLQSHTHTITFADRHGGTSATLNNGNYNDQVSNQTKTSSAPSGRTGTTTHGKQKGILWCIRG